MTDVFLGVDQGTSSTKSVLVSREGETLFVSRVSAPPVIERERSAEQDPEQILASVIEAFNACLDEARSRNYTVSSWGLATQRSGVVAWNKFSGEPVSPMMTWADTSTYAIIDGFGREVDRITEQTGLPTIANFAAPKIFTLQRRFQDASTYVATLDAFLLHRLTNGLRYTTEDTMAARTMLYGIRERSWSDDLCRRFRVDKKRLPEIRASLFCHGVYEGIPLTAMLGDQQAALIASGMSANQPLLNLGSIGSLVMTTGGEIILKPGLKTSVEYSEQEDDKSERRFVYLSELTYPSLGTTLQALLSKQWCSTSEEISKMCEASLATSKESKAHAYWTDRTEFSATWPDGVPNVMLTKPDAQNCDRVRAVIENIGNHIVLMLEEFAEKELLDTTPNGIIAVSGGVSANDYLLQYVADVSGYSLRRNLDTEATARGAALASMMYTEASTAPAGTHKIDSPTIFSPRDPERRGGFMKWQLFRRDVLVGKITTAMIVE